MMHLFNLIASTFLSFGFCLSQNGCGGRSRKQMLSYTLFLLEKWAENTPNVCRFRSRNRADPFLYSPLFYILHQVCGLTLQDIANLIQCLYWKMLDRTHTDGRHRGRSDACPLRQFLLGHIPQSKHYFDLELNHRNPPFLRIHHTTKCVMCQYEKRKIIYAIRKNIHEKRIDELRFS